MNMYNHSFSQCHLPSENFILWMKNLSQWIFFYSVQLRRKYCQSLIKDRFLLSLFLILFNTPTYKIRKQPLFQFLFFFCIYILLQLSFQNSNNTISRTNIRIRWYTLFYPVALRIAKFSHFSNFKYYKCNTFNNSHYSV